MTVLTHTLERRTRGDDHILDLTDELQALVHDSGISVGQLTVMVVGSTAALTTIEFEPGLVGHDIAAALERIAPRPDRTSTKRCGNKSTSSGIERPGLLDLLENPAQDESKHPFDDRDHKNRPLPGGSSCSRPFPYVSIRTGVSAIRSALRRRSRSTGVHVCRSTTFQGTLCPRFR